MIVKRIWAFVILVTVAALSAADPEGVLNGWDLRRIKGGAQAALSADGGVVEIKTGDEVAEGNRFRAEICQSGSIAKVKLTISGNAEFCAGCHLYDKKNKWLQLVKSEEITISGVAPRYAEFNFPIPTCENGEVYMIRPFIRVNPGETLNIHRYELSIKKPPEDKSKWNTGGTFPKYFERLADEDGDFGVRFLPSFGKVILDRVELPFCANANDIAKLRVKVISLADQRPALVFEAPFAFGEIKAFVADLPAGLNGEYRVEGEYIDARGKVIQRGRGVTKVMFQDLNSGWYRVGEIKRNAHLPNIVRPYPMGQTTFYFGKYPFQAEKIESAAYPGFAPIVWRDRTAQVVNRDYVIGDNGLPSAIFITQSEPTRGAEKVDILAAPIAVELDGKVLPGKDLSVELKDAVLHSSAVLGEVLKLQAELYPDGVMKVQISPLANFPTSARNLRLSVPLRANEATLLHELTDVTYRRRDLSKTGIAAGIGGNTGFLPEKKISGDRVWQSADCERTGKGSFNPYIWLGNEDRGIAYFAEGDRSWQVDAEFSAQDIERDGDVVRLNINLINRGNGGKVKNDACWVLGLVATPVKNPPAHFRGTIFPRWMFFDRKFYDQLSNVRKIVEIGAGHKLFTSGTCSILPFDAEATKQEYEKLRDNLGSTYMEYYCSDYINHSIPELAMYFGEWSSGNLGYYGMRNPSNWFGPSKSYDFNQASWIGARRIMPSFLQYRLWCLEQKMKAIGQFSFYEDNIHLRKFFEPALGIGYFDADGDARFQYDTWTLRDYYFNIARLYQKYGLENLSGAHASAEMNIAPLTACTYYIDGEQPGRRVTKPQEDYIDLWKDLDYFRAHILGRQYGIRSIFLSEITHKNPDPAVNLRQSRAFMAVMLIHDVGIWDGAIYDRAPVRAWHKVVNDLDFYHEEPRLLPYWGTPEYRAAEVSVPDLYVTGYRQKGRTLLVVSNFGDEREVELELNTAALGFTPVSVVDAENPNSAVQLTGNQIKLTIPRHDYRLILVRE